MHVPTLTLTLTLTHTHTLTRDPKLLEADRWPAPAVE